MIITEQLKALWKRVLSYFRKSREIEDYPLKFKKQSVTTGENIFGEVKPWIVQVINWSTMAGLGGTKEEAFEQLKINFKDYLDYNTAPRPGKRVALQYAGTLQIDEMEDIAVDFFEKVLGINYYNCFISDLSSLSDFGRNDIETLNKINAVYNLVLTETGDGSIVRLLKMIKDYKKS